MAATGSQHKFCYYRVLHRYTPPDDYLDKGYLVIEEGDVIQVPRPVDLEKGTEEQPDGWLKGKNTKNNLEGYFPSGEYVQFIVGKNISSDPPVPKPRPLGATRRHSLKPTFFVRPILCSCCQDFIWGVGVVGVICKDCCQCFHKECESLAVSFGGCSKSLPAKQPPVHDQQIPLSKWDISNVADWMAVVNLHRYAHVFMKFRIKGDDLSKVSVSMLQGMRIEDEFHQKSILACIEKLCSKQMVDPVPLVEPNGSSKNDHRFIVYSFSSMQPCHMCGEYLWGLIQQGYQCRDCALCCHRKCAVGNLPKCSADKLMNLRRLSFTLNTVFGVPLSEQFSVSSGIQAPPIVIRFTKELEKRSQSKGIKVVDAYRSPGSTVEINRLKRHISEGTIEDIDLDSFDHICLAGALKKYLRDLPNAVIHEDSYDQFVKEAKKEEGDEHCKRSLVRLVEELPTHHRNTLEYLLEHFVRCIQKHSGTEDSIKDAVQKLARVFCQILIRPPWDSIIEIVFNAENSLRVVSLLLQLKLQPVPTTSRTPADQQSIEKEEWYWKDISKEDLNERMSNTPDGTFLVRDSSDGVKDNYTLAVKKGGSNRLLRIYHRDGKFGLMEPLTFNSVVELINYYTNNSLEHFNKTLDIKLTFPVCRPVFNPTEMKDTDILSCKKAYVKADKEYNEEAKKFEKLHEEHMQITEDLQMRHQALEAFRETIAMFEENIKIVVKNERLVPQSEVAKARDNFEMLKRQLKAVVERLNKLETEVRDLTHASKNKSKNMNAMKPDLQLKCEMRDQLRQKLLKCGETPRTLEQLIAYQEENGNSSPELATSHSDQSTWLVKYDRKHAVELLEGKPDGTFLIRPRNEQDFPFGLSIVSNNDVVHCKIGKKDTGYGFADPFFIHETLMDLVLHYKDTSLVEHNDVLDVMLDFPVLGTVFTKSANKHIAPSPRAAPTVPRRARHDNYESFVG